MADRSICVAFMGLSFLTSYVGGILRLNGGDDQYEGRLEIYDNGEWQTICRDNWNNNNAIVACRQLGLKGGSWRRVTASEVGDKTFLSEVIDCQGSENRLEACSSTGKDSSGCKHSDKDEVYVTCKPKKDGVLRLHDGPIQYEGRLEIYHDSKWGTICRDKWDAHPQNAQVACRQLGYEGGSFREVSYSERASSSVEFWMDDVKCHGNETSLQDCPFRGWGNDNCYSYSDEIYLQCTERKDTLTRLVGGPNQYEGRLEVYHDGQWGSVCIQRWDIFVLNAHVACRQLGNTGGSFRPVTTAERGEGPFWMDGIECDCDEINLHDCNFKGWGDGNCSHSTNDDVFLQCNPIKGAVQLVDGNNRYSGRVQVFATGKWITLCNDEWTNNNLKVTCRQLGTIEKRSGQEVFTEGYYYEGDFECEGTEEYLYKCRYRDRKCSSDEKVKATCEIPVSPRNGSCDIDLQETCDTTLSCQNVNGFGRCICDTESFWDEKTNKCKKKVSYNEVCDPNVDDVCTSDLSCELVKGSTSFQNTCICPEKNDFWDTFNKTCRIKKFYAEVCDPTVDDVCTSDLSCEPINGTSLNKCICPEEDDFWDSSYRACRRRTGLQGIYLADKLNISDAISNCESKYKGRLATEEHLRQIFSNCTDYADDTWLIRIEYPATEKQLDSCAILYSDGELKTKNCTGRRASVCMTKKNNKNDLSCFGFPTLPQKATSSSGLIGGVVAVLIILAVVVMLVIGLLYRRRKKECKKDSDMVNNPSYDCQWECIESRYSIII
ncbi:neurotrypsin-like isoform X2 [Mizuhopecten yessoensis]|uniref:neurotrypsin-like isoform X2 n=1 Tax=Mizuhopecten yessoensis TaxID=6573 RepID=UPI000B45CBAE|nr:neurotrypsin-like isoform X2 [Mizuhopecten yessoensis]